MMRYPLCVFADWAAGTWHGISAEKEIISLNGWHNDTRSIQPGQGFVALRTEQRDGHRFLVAAQRAGAGAAIVEVPDPEVSIPQLCVADSLAALQAIAEKHRKNFEGNVIGITGSFGKTSTKDILAQLLGEDQTLKTSGNYNNSLGVPLTLSQLDLQQHAFAVIEAGINQLNDMDGLATMLQPEMTIITGIGPSHLEKLGTLENIANEKIKLATMARAGDGPVLFPHDCWQYPAFRKMASRAWVLCPGEKAGEPIRAKQLFYYNTTHQAGEGCRLELRSAAFGLQSFKIPLMSQGMVRNVCLAIIAAAQSGVASERIQDALVQWQPSALRGELCRAGDRIFYVDCYNANPASMVEGFAAFSLLTDPRLPRLYVLGCMAELGSDSVDWHRKTGRELNLRPQDRVIIIGEHATPFADGVVQAGNQPEQVDICTSLAEVKGVFDPFIGAVMLKGSRNYQLEQLIADNREGPIAYLNEHSRC